MIFDELIGRYRSERGATPIESTYLSSPTRDVQGGADSSPEPSVHSPGVDTRGERPPLLSDAPRPLYGVSPGREPVEDWGEGGDLDRSVSDPSPRPIEDPNHPDYVEPWFPPTPGDAR